MYKVSTWSYNSEKSGSSVIKTIDISSFLTTRVRRGACFVFAVHTGDPSNLEQEKWTPRNVLGKILTVFLLFPPSTFLVNI